MGTNARRRVRRIRKMPNNVTSHVQRLEAGRSDREKDHELVDLEETIAAENSVDDHNNWGENVERKSFREKIGKWWERRKNHGVEYI